MGDSPAFERVVKTTPSLTLSMIVKNEEHRYLGRVLESAREYIDSAVIIDDGSTDNTVSLCRELLAGIPLKLIENKESMFQNEAKLRKLQWDETIATNPDWILFLDADEIFEEKAKSAFRAMITDKECDLYLFRLYDMWNEEQYRDDALWSAHKIYRPFMMRYQKNFGYVFLEANQHCGRMPANIFELNYLLSNVRLKHYGWANPEDRLAKFNRYMQLDSLGIYGSLFQYQSILDAHPNLCKWSNE
jgi:glycosyltransferase involved in cell wall biosynthesis